MFKLEGQVSKLGKKHQGYESGLAKTVASSWTTCNRSVAPFFSLGVPDPKGITRRNPSHRSRKGLGNNSWETYMGFLCQRKSSINIYGMDYIINISICNGKKMTHITSYNPVYIYIHNIYIYLCICIYIYIHVYKMYIYI